MSLESFIFSVQQYCRDSRYRYCLVLSGDSAWSTNIVKAITENEDFSYAYLSSQPPNYLKDNTCYRPLSQAAKLLGQEFDNVIYDALSGMAPDALGVIGGTVKAGGLLILIAPDSTSWPSLSDPLYKDFISYGFEAPSYSYYVQRFLRICQNSSGCLVLEQSKAAPPLPKALPDIWNRNFSEQKTALIAIRQVIDGQRRRPLVLTSDRGRGKSAALGMAAKQLFEKGVGKIVVTSARKEAVEKVFSHAGLNFKDTNTYLIYLPVDQLLQEKIELDLLMVDEAASIPLSQLSQLLENYSRIVFASTVHGYEGTGRGFAIRFKKILDEKTRGWKAETLTTPIRWREDDPLESFLFESLLLNAEPKTNISISSKSKFLVSEHTQSELSEDSELLNQIFGLLVQAHYRTQPSDLRYLLDAPNLRIFSISSNGIILGCALISIEGNLEPENALAIWKNQRRPKGHVLPEILCSQMGLLEAPGLNFARILRIAILPEVRRIGIGDKLLKHIENSFANQVDLLGAVFGLSEQALGFWLKNQYRPVRLGHKQSQNTASHACTLIKPITSRGQSIAHTATSKFDQGLPILLRNSLHNLEPKLALPILQSSKSIPAKSISDEQYLMDLIGFAFANHSFENTLSALNNYALSFLSNAHYGAINNEDLYFVIRKILQNKTWDELKSTSSIDGKKQGLEKLRKILKAALLETNQAQVREIIKRFNI